MNRANLIAVPSDSRDIPNGSKPNSCWRTTSAGVRLSISSPGTDARSCCRRSRRPTKVLYSGAMSESFVDLTYRGLTLGRKVKLTQVRPSSGILEHVAPLPVGTSIGIASDDGTLFDAVVTDEREQPGAAAASKPVRPRLEVEAAKAWWKEK